MIRIPRPGALVAASHWATSPGETVTTLELHGPEAVVVELAPIPRVTRG